MLKGVVSFAVTIGILIGIYAYNTKTLVTYEAPFELYRGEDTNVIIKNKIIEDSRNNVKQQRTMDSSLVMLIVSTAGILFTSLWNYKGLKKDMIKLFTGMDEKNTVAHDGMMLEIKRLKECDTMEIDLREVLADCIKSAPHGIQRFINFEAENNIKFCKEIVNSKFDHTSIKNIKSKIESYSLDAQNEAVLLPAGFRKDFLTIQLKNTSLAFEGIEKILYDEERNSKVHRFRQLMTRILNTHLNEIIDAYVKHTTA